MWGCNYILHRKEKGEGEFCRRIVGMKRELNDTLLECRVWKVVCNTTSPLTNEWTKIGPHFIRYILTANFQNPPKSTTTHCTIFWSIHLLLQFSLFSNSIFFFHVFFWLYHTSIANWDILTSPLQLLSLFPFFFFLTLPKS